MPNVSRVRLNKFMHLSKEKYVICREKKNKETESHESFLKY